MGYQKYSFILKYGQMSILFSPFAVFSDAGLLGSGEMAATHGGK